MDILLACVRAVGSFDVMAARGPGWSAGLDQDKKFSF
jgi:hypothetical protein